MFPSLVISSERVPGISVCIIHLFVLYYLFVDVLDFRYQSIFVGLCKCSVDTLYGLCRHYCLPVFYICNNLSSYFFLVFIVQILYTVCLPSQLLARLYAVYLFVIGACLFIDKQWNFHWIIHGTFFWLVHSTFHALGISAAKPCIVVYLIVTSFLVFTEFFIIQLLYTVASPS